MEWYRLVGIIVRIPDSFVLQCAGGKAVACIDLMVKSAFAGMSAELVDQAFSQLIGNPKAVILWHRLLLRTTLPPVPIGGQILDN